MERNDFITKAFKIIGEKRQKNIELLVHILMSDKSPESRREASLHLGEQGGEFAIKNLLNAFDAEPSYQVKTALLEALGMQMHDKRVVAKINSVANIDPSQELRTIALRIIREDKEFVETLEQEYATEVRNGAPIHKQGHLISEVMSIRDFVLELLRPQFVFAGSTLGKEETERSFSKKEMNIRSSLLSNLGYEEIILRGKYENKLLSITVMLSGNSEKPMQLMLRTGNYEEKYELGGKNRKYIVTFAPPVNNPDEFSLVVSEV